MIKRELYTSRYLPPAPIWYVSETNSQDLVFVLADYDAPEGAEARIHVTRSDGTIAYVSANLSTVGGTDMVTVRPSTGLFTVPGPAIIQVQITDGATGREYVSFPVPCQVASNCTGSGEEAGDTINVFNEQLEEFKRALEEDFSESYIHYENISGEDCDELPNGEGIGVGVTNTPAADDESVYVKTMIQEDGAGIQEAIVIATNERWIRTCTDGTWSEWSRDEGPKGDKGDKGDAGVSPTVNVTQTSSGARITITDASGTTTANINNGSKGDTGATGPQGPAGTTPVKGTDYFTPADIADIVDDVIAALNDADTTGY